MHNCITCGKGLSELTTFTETPSSQWRTKGMDIYPKYPPRPDEIRTQQLNKEHRKPVSQGRLRKGRKQKHGNRHSSIVKMIASTMSPLEWPHQGRPATPPRQDDHTYPPPLQWWPPTPGSSREETCLLTPPSIISPPFSPFSAFANQPPMFAPSPFLQPFMSTGQQLQPPPHHHHNQMSICTSTSSSTSPSPFATASTASTSPFASAQPSPGTTTSCTFPPPPSNARSSPLPFCSVGGSSPQPAFLQPSGAGLGLGLVGATGYAGSSHSGGVGGVLKRNSFLKLPPEVRAAIYQELVPETDLHVTMDTASLGCGGSGGFGGGGKMFSYPCRAMGDAEFVGRHWFAMTEPEYRRLGSTSRECGHLACVRMGPKTRGLGRDDRGWVGLVTSCKAIHDEFSPYLYARPRLIFDDAGALRRFLETADSSLLRRYVRNLSISYLVPECPTSTATPSCTTVDMTTMGLGMSFHRSHQQQKPHQQRQQQRAKTDGLDDWTRSWQGIALLEGLKHLRVTLVARGAFANREYQARVLGPMMLRDRRGKVGGREGGNDNVLEDFQVVSFEGTRECGLPRGFNNAPFAYSWRAWSLLAGPELERVARRHKQFVDAQPPYWHHLSSYHQHSFYRGGGDINMRSLYSVM